MEIFNPIDLSSPEGHGVHRDLATLSYVTVSEKRGNFEQNKNFEFLASNCSTHYIGIQNLQGGLAENVLGIIVLNLNYGCLTATETVFAVCCMMHQP